MRRSVAGRSAINQRRISAASRAKRKEGRKGTRSNLDVNLCDAEQEDDAYRETVDLSTLVEEACQDAAAVQPQRPIRARVEPGVEVSGDPNQLARLLANLLGNVRMHTPADTPVEVVLQATYALRPHPQAVLTVRDHGPGIPETALPHVFDRFYRVDKGRSRAAGGSGLGLAIVAATVAAHQGTVTVAAPEDGAAGLLVTVHLPLLVPLPR
jgi:two-component system, OmpR family, sensor kinase